MKMNISTPCILVGVILTCAVFSLQADTVGGSYPYMPKNTPETNPAFQASVAPRKEKEYQTGNYAAVWGGANLFQQADPSVKDNYGLGIKAGLDLKDAMNFAVGAKIGHIWDLDGLKFYGEKSSLKLMPSVEGEFIYTQNNGSKLQWNGTLTDGVDTVSGELNQKYDMSIYALTVNPILRVQWGMFRPYIGFGIGGAYLNAENKGINGKGTINGSPASGEVWSGGGSESEVVFCFQGIAGTDIFLNDRWSVFVEYKYLGLVGLEFDKAIGGNATYEMGDIYGNHLAVVGIKFHY